MRAGYPVASKFPAGLSVLGVTNQLSKILTVIECQKDLILIVKTLLISSPSRKTRIELSNLGTCALVPLENTKYRPRRGHRPDFLLFRPRPQYAQNHYRHIPTQPNHIISTTSRTSSSLQLQKVHLPHGANASPSTPPS